MSCNCEFCNDYWEGFCPICIHTQDEDCKLIEECKETKEKPSLFKIVD